MRWHTTLGYAQWLCRSKKVSKKVSKKKTDLKKSLIRSMVSKSQLLRHVIKICIGITETEMTYLGAARNPDFFLFTVCSV